MRPLFCLANFGPVSLGETENLAGAIPKRKASNMGEVYSFSLRYTYKTKSDFIIMSIRGRKRTDPNRIRTESVKVGSIRPLMSIPSV